MEDQEKFKSDKTSHEVNSTKEGHVPAIHKREQFAHKFQFKKISKIKKGIIMKEKNKSCKWRDDFTWICFNGDSEMCADVADDDYCMNCKLFEEKN